MLKPSVVLLTADGNPLLLDFNLAREGSPVLEIDEVNDPGGTLPYMAPERLCDLSGSAALRAVSGKCARGTSRLPDSECSSCSFAEALSEVFVHIKPTFTLSVSFCWRC